MFCTKCGNEISKGAKFCTKCGKAIDGKKNTAKVIMSEAGQKNVQLKKKSSKLPIIIMVIGIVVVLVLIGVVVSLLVDKKDGGIQREEIETSNSVAETNPFENGLTVGGTVYFGEYEQDNDTSNGVEPILWDVIGQNENGVLLISHFVLDNKPFEEENKGIVDYATGISSNGITWENSSIRTWLNNDFIQEAFSANEQSYIVPVLNSTSDFKDTLGQEEHYYGYKGGIGGADTNDRVFLLSIEEYWKYMNPSYVGYLSYIYASIDALAGPTKYARAQGINIEEYKDSWLVENGVTGTFDKDYNGVYSFWMLRNPGSAEDQITIMSIDGLGHVAASHHVNAACGVRPAIWVSAVASEENVTDEEILLDAYSQIIGYWKPKKTYSSLDTFWLSEPDIIEITEYMITIHGTDYWAYCEDLEHIEKNGIDYFTSKENGFRFYYSPDDAVLVLEIKLENGNWYRWVDFE
uniref:DUF6273 domain-containing protein n=1 Tax=Acetatifactor sp. TaxID=1872090 RepID=UPI004055FF08